MLAFLSYYCRLCVRFGGESLFLQNTHLYISMKRTILLMVLLLVGCAAMQAQTALKYGYLHYDSLLVKMSDYAAAQEQLATLRKQYQQETDYNEQGFKRQFAEFLQGQKNFPQNILLKRQRDLQEAMEKSIAFRQSAEELIKKAAVDLLQPVRQRLDAAIREVGMERGYQFVLNLDNNTVPFVHPQIGEDATPYVREKLKR